MDESGVREIMTQSGTSHFSDEQMQLALTGQLPDNVCDQLAEHLVVCASCRARMDGMLREENFHDSVVNDNATLELPPLNHQEHGRLKAMAIMKLQKSRQTDELPTWIGRYRVIRLINTGGMCRVYECMDERLSRRVAIKVLTQYSNDTKNLQRLKREAKLQAGLRHPNVVQVFEVDSEATPPFLVMELMEGGTLKDLHRTGPMPPRKAALIVARVARAVHEAHELGFLHRDIKPSNILIAEPFDIAKDSIESLHVKVGDFGLARAFDSASDLTKTEIIVGTPAYMSPEQTQRSEKPLCPTSDIYTLGVVLYELLVGRPPLVADHFGLTLAMIRELDPIAPRSIQPNVSKDMNTICMKCLEKDPERRYKTALALAEDLESNLSDKPIRARPVSEVARAWRWCRRNRLVAISLGLASLSIILLTSASVWFAIFQKQLKEEADQNRLIAKYETEKAVLSYKQVNEQKFRFQQEYFNEIQRSILQLKELALTPKEKFTPELVAELNRLNRKKWLESSKELYSQLENEFSQPEFSLQLTCFIAENLEADTPADELALWRNRLKLFAQNFSASTKVSNHTLELIHRATLNICSQAAPTIQEKAELADWIYRFYPLDRLNEPPSTQTRRQYAQLSELVNQLTNAAGKPQISP